MAPGRVGAVVEDVRGDLRQVSIRGVRACCREHVVLDLPGRFVHSGFLGGDDWESEHEAMRAGDAMYLRTLGTYLTFFPGRTAVPVTAWGPMQPDEDTVWAGLRRGLGLPAEVAEGGAARFTIGGSTVDGVVDSVLRPSFLGVRTEDALYRFVGRNGRIGIGHHLFAPGTDRRAATSFWHHWLTELFA